MGYKRLYILIEGNDDERFFNHIIKPEFEKKYDYVQFFQYASQPSRKINNFIKSIIAMEADYIIAGDINHAPCVTHKKKTIKTNKFKNKIVDEGYIVVIIKEIESWYLAGLDAGALNKIEVSYGKKNTDTLTKEQFERLMPRKFISKIDFLQESLKYFKMETAKQQNRSFNFFTRKYEI